MASPTTIAPNTTSTITTAVTPHTVTVGNPTAGQLLIVAARYPAAAGSVTFTGYTPLVTANTSDASDDETYIWYRWADGTEGVTDSCAPTNAVKGCYVNWKVSGAENPATQPPEVSSVATGTTAANSANPPSVAGTGGSKDYLFIAIMGLDGEGNAPFTAPTSYGELGSANTGTAGAVGTNCSVGGANRELTAASDDPSTFAHGAAATGWTAFTVVVHPPGAGGSTYEKAGFGEEAG